MNRSAADQAAGTIPAQRTGEHAETFAELAERIATTAPRFTPDQLARIGAVLDAGASAEAVAS